jgi:hypothetical protein
VKFESLYLRMITALGILYLPFCLLFWRNAPRLLDLIFIGSVFSAGAVIVIGGYGVTTALVPALMFIGFVLLKLTLGTNYPAQGMVLGVLAPFMLVATGAIISSFLMPRLFEGEIMVWPQKLAGFFVLTPLAPNSGNYTQDMYLLINATLTVTASIYLTRTGFDLRRLLNAFYASALLAVAISLWQFAANTLHIWFPSSFFLSNPGWAILTAESIGSIIRITGPFSEPAALAGYMCGAVSASAWAMLNGDKARLPRVVFFACLLVLLLTTSTTGYAALAILIAMLAAYTVITGTPRLKKRVAAGAAAAMVVIVISVATVPVLAPGIARDVVTITNATLDKKSSSSYSDRTSTDHDSIKEMVESYGLGVGWGSNRSSSLGPGLCASVGIWGVLGLLWFAGGVVALVRAAHREAGTDKSRLVMHACSAWLIGTLTAAFLSGPSLSGPDFYLTLALLIATAARVRYDARSARLAVRAAPAGRTLGFAPTQTTKG